MTAITRWPVVRKRNVPTRLVRQRMRHRYIRLYVSPDSNGVKLAQEMTYARESFERGQSCPASGPLGTLLLGIWQGSVQLGPALCS